MRGLARQVPKRQQNESMTLLESLQGNSLKSEEEVTNSDTRGGGYQGGTGVAFWP